MVFDVEKANSKSCIVRLCSSELIISAIPISEIVPKLPTIESSDRIVFVTKFPFIIVVIVNIDIKNGDILWKGDFLALLHLNCRKDIAYFDPLVKK